MCSQQSLDFITVTANNRFSAIFTTVFLPRSTGNVPLPITSEVYRLAALHCQRGYAAHLIAIRDAAIVVRAMNSSAHSEADTRLQCDGGCRFRHGAGD
jgi:hypothetical protein